METFRMSRKEAPRPGLLKAALAGRISTDDAARALAITVRHVRRLKARLRDEGVASVPHALRGRASPRRLPAALQTRVTSLMQTTYAGFNDVHLTEKLREVHGLGVSRASVRRLRLALGLPAQRPRRAPAHRARRPRADAAGRLVQLDGSQFAWLEDRGPTLTLLGAIDDATSEVLALWFRPHEDLHGYATLLEQICRTHGAPVGLYGDRLNVFVRNDSHWSPAEELAGVRTPTHFGRMLADLGIGYIAAQSPQGKGRVERLWGTLQDRLVSELRLRGIRTVDAANAFLADYVPAHNRRFAKPPPDLPRAWRPAPRDLTRILSCRYTRVVSRDNTVTLGERVVSLAARARGRSWAGRRIDVRELLDGRLLVVTDGAVIAQHAAPPGFTLVPRRAPRGAQDRSAPVRLAPDRPQSAQEARSARGPLSPPSRKPRKPRARPAASHPWLTSLRYHVARKELRARLRLTPRRTADISTEQ
jgi:transposase